MSSHLRSHNHAYLCAWLNLVWDIKGSFICVTSRLGGNTGCWLVTSWIGVSFVSLLTLELLENMASDNNVCPGVSSDVTFKHFRSEIFWSMADESGITCPKSVFWNIFSISSRCPIHPELIFTLFNLDNSSPLPSSTNCMYILLQDSTYQFHALHHSRG